MSGSCRRCGRSAPGTVEELYEAGWGDSATLCPSCRAERNLRASRAAGRIASGLADMYAQQWAGSGPVRARKVEIHELPSMAIRSVFVVGDGTPLDSDDARKVWKELGDGAYLVKMSSGVAQVHVAVQVTDGEVDMEPIDEDQVAMLPALARALTTGGGPIQ